MMVGTNLKDVQLQQIVDKTILIADKDGDGKISFEEFSAVSCFALLIFPRCSLSLRLHLLFLFQLVSKSIGIQNLNFIIAFKPSHKVP